MQQMNRAQAEYLVNTYSDAILRLSYTYLKSTHDAQDICQTVFLRYMTAGLTFDDPARERAWILRTAANACRDVLRSAWRRRTCGLEACGQMAAPPMPVQSPLAEAVQQLPDQYRIPLYLHYYEGYSIAEVAEILGMRPAAINSRLSRGREKLRKQLGGTICEQGV